MEFNVKDVQAMHCTPCPGTLRSVIVIGEFTLMGVRVKAVLLVTIRYTAVLN